tara:strand:+ start:18080 stop:19354 length:1275 start_codon:yes stop_codon:yes gene_type:complete
MKDDLKRNDARNSIDLYSQYHKDQHHELNILLQKIKLSKFNYQPPAAYVKTYTSQDAFELEKEIYQNVDCENMPNLKWPWPPSEFKANYLKLPPAFPDVYKPKKNPLLHFILHRAASNKQREGITSSTANINNRFSYPINIDHSSISSIVECRMPKRNKIILEQVEKYWGNNQQINLQRIKSLQNVELAIEKKAHKLNLPAFDYEKEIAYKLFVRANPKYQSLLKPNLHKGLPGFKLVSQINKRKFRSLDSPEEKKLLNYLYTNVIRYMKPRCRFNKSAIHCVHGDANVDNFFNPGILGDYEIVYKQAVPQYSLSMLLKTASPCLEDYTKDLDQHIELACKLRHNGNKSAAEFRDIYDRINISHTLIHIVRRSNYALPPQQEIRNDYDYVKELMKKLGHNQIAPNLDEIMKNVLKEEILGILNI